MFAAPPLQIIGALMDLMTYEVISPRDNLALPTAVIDELVDLAVACNYIVDAIQTANLGESRAQGLIYSANSDRRSARHTRKAANELALSALDYTEHLILIYARHAATYATSTVRVAGAIAAGRPAPESMDTPIEPSQIIKEPHTYVPLVCLGQDHEVLASTHEAVMGALSRMTADTAMFYEGDRERSMWRRPTGSVEVDAALPSALHAYAAALAFAVSSHFDSA
ncbi:hypothetical protein GCM10022225_26540 [Plantactinospora mayteni]|uniref:Uncharacterized protein n=1 Tax=Plantactinospora mayteni TaxID=566021 RepID=A0ABQ4EIQ1_9ACTN|nr:hypothetical protein [Plantactinospora mayteni]GIG94616.1 hypothetical protein Pma05_11890 [Plantactinospora mayteni]